MTRFTVRVSRASFARWSLWRRGGGTASGWVALLLTVAVRMDGAPVTALAFSPDGSVLVNGGQGGIEVRRGADAVVQRRIPLDLAKVRSVAFHPDGRLMAVAGGAPGRRGEVWILEWPEGTVRSRWGAFGDVATSVGFSVDGKLVGAASADHGARVWGVENGAERYELRGHAGPVLALAFSPTGDTVVTAGGDRSVKVWSTEDGRLLRQFDSHTEAVHALAFRPEPSGGPMGMPAVCATGGEDHTVRVWQPEIGRMVRIVRGHSGSAFAVVYRADGGSLFSAGEEGVIREIDASSDRIVREWKGHRDWVYALAVSSDGSWLASGDWAGEVRVWRIGGCQ